MKILKEDILGVSDFLLEGEFDFSDREIDDALVKSIKNCNYKITNIPLDKDETLLKVSINSKVNYLDARTLSELILDINFEEDIPFSFNQEQAEELDIDFFEEEIDIKELVFELIIVNIPFNYSKEKNPNVLSEEEFYINENKPFANLLKK